MWPGAEPTRGQYNQSYFDTAKQIVQNLAAKDIQVLLDMHQDLLSEKFCGEGNTTHCTLVIYLILISTPLTGVPPWAALPDNIALPFPFPVWGFQKMPVDNVTGTTKPFVHHHQHTPPF